MTEESRFKPDTVCYFKIKPTSVDYHVNGQFVTIKSLVLASDGKTRMWTYVPDIYSPPRLGKNFEYALERTLVPIAGPTVDDVQDTLEVLSLANNTSFDALREIAKKVDRENTLEEIE